MHKENNTHTHNILAPVILYFVNMIYNFHYGKVKSWFLTKTFICRACKRTVSNLGENIA